MRCQGKMICHIVRWGTLYFTVHFRVIPSPVARKESAGAKDGSFSLFSLHTEKESPEFCSSQHLASPTSPSTPPEKHKTAFSSAYFCSARFSISHLPQETWQERNPPLPRGQHPKYSEFLRASRFL